MAESASHTRRREKPVLSCRYCRRRKQSPCKACVERGNVSECIYSCSEEERMHAIDYRPHIRSQPARQRIARLENLVIEMRNMAQTPGQQMDGDAASILPDPRSSHAAADGHLMMNDMGKLSLTDDHAVYTGSSHWVTILEDIQQLKDELSNEYSNNTSNYQSTVFDDDQIHASTTAEISLLNSGSRLPKEQILTMMPPRKIVDRHVAHFFSSFDMASCILHRNKFLAEYANFWNSPSSAPIMWLGLLFSIMTVSAFLQQQLAGALGLSAADSQELLKTYRTLTIHCLVAGDYLQPSSYTIETLVLHFGVDQNLNSDASINSWMLIGVIIRIALRMGLHRDPSHWSDIRPLQAEMRRRLWITLYQMDFFLSTQVGLPRIIKDSQCDTRPPRHLFDRDLGFENDEVPPERPLNESTPLLFIIQRNDIIRVAAEIYDATEAGPPSSATMAMLGGKIETAINAIPSWLKYSPLEASIALNPVTLLQQMFVDILIQKAIYLLHRRSFLKGSAGEVSDELCIKAALAILEHQRRMHEEIQTGGLMFAIRWKVASALNHEFLQATMMLCFTLSRFTEGTVGSYALHRREEIIQALTLARSLWDNIADQSTEARRAAKAITIVLQQASNTSSAFTSMPPDGELPLHKCSMKLLIPMAC
ncbi:hypothetical protein EJ08DRAFT_591012 [Tothia fuscella]|uniref:Xylanolytic transcriptional activator regulatory domain-containing protein n=1 Tax=Tothia fuscella TaxID=1048955 RepID=A0A9P4NPW9_9PEZI|nr:hypothetical protein EJ08DRAFT_591012 [Tothia fuscella]